MANLIIILADQLSESISCLKNYASNEDIVLMCEVLDEETSVKHHKKKIAFLFSAMRHFCQQLKSNGYKIEYTKLDDSDNTNSLKGEVIKALKKYSFERIIVTYPSEYQVLKNIQQWQSDLNISVEIRPDDRFLCSIEDFAEWAKDKKQLRMEYFYREMRKKYSILICGNEPSGGKWNFDASNRKPPKENLRIPSPYINETDEITKEVMRAVAERFDDHFGDLEPFYFAVTRIEALKVLSTFIEERLSSFGDYQDAMIEGEPWMYHSHISFYLNCGLLLPLECVQDAESAYLRGKAPLNAVEGFIRQIIGQPII